MREARGANGVSASKGGRRTDVSREQRASRTARTGATGGSDA
ncbi:hypothetical protein BN903_119 [Halorubrum sp. AJ67]|nr:hypothetical protein BN903_119 [Halorubrum sp. AJ67]